MPFSHFVGISRIIGVIVESAGLRYGIGHGLLLGLELILGFALIDSGSGRRNMHAVLLDLDIREQLVLLTAEAKWPRADSHAGRF
jgi:hypothetical protein